jgi:AcrR family transcriptional regulator
VSGPGARRSRAEQREDTRRRLLDAAAAAFAEHGFQGASIDDITARAGFTRGAFYSNFTDKTDLLVQLCERRLDRFVEAKLPAVRDQPAEERLALVARWLVSEEPPVELLLMVELARLRERDAGIAATLDHVLETTLGAVDQLVSRETVMGELSAPVRRERVLAVVAGVLGTDLLRHLGVTTGPGVVEHLLQAAIDPQPPAEPGDDTEARG